MNLTQLNCFIVVAETLSFTKAAQRLNFVQSAVSSKIAELDASLGVELFARNNRYVRLTGIGERLLAKAYKIMSLVDECHVQCEQFKRGLTGSLSVGYVFAPTMRSVMYLFDQFSETRPEVNIRLHAFPAGKMARAAADNDVDLIITCPNTISSHLGALVYKPLITENYKVILNRKNPLAGEKEILVDQLGMEDFCIMDRRINTGLFSDIISMCSKANFSPRVVSESNDIAALLFALEMNRGVSILPANWEKYITAYEELIFADLIGAGTKRVVGLSWNRNNTNPALELFLSTMNLV
jgi:DNA-binding transcriptional LysR family regulator